MVLMKFKIIEKYDDFVERKRRDIPYGNSQRGWIKLLLWGLFIIISLIILTIFWWLGRFWGLGILTLIVIIIEFILIYVTNNS